MAEDEFAYRVGPLMAPTDFVAFTSRVSEPLAPGLQARLLIGADGSRVHVAGQLVDEQRARPCTTGFAWDESARCLPIAAANVIEGLFVDGACTKPIAETPLCKPTQPLVAVEGDSAVASRVAKASKTATGACDEASKYEFFAGATPLVSSTAYEQSLDGTKCEGPGQAPSPRPGQSLLQLGAAIPPASRPP